MALSESEKASLAEILRIPHPDLVATELLEITAAQETILQADIARWIVVRLEYGSLNGGGSGVVFHPGDERSAIRRRVISLLDCQATVNAYAANGGGGNILRG